MTQSGHQLSEHRCSANNRNPLCARWSVALVVFHRRA